MNHEIVTEVGSIGKDYSILRFTDFEANSRAFDGYKTPKQYYVARDVERFCELVEKFEQDGEPSKELRRLRSQQVVRILGRVLYMRNGHISLMTHTLDDAFETVRQDVGSGEEQKELVEAANFSARADFGQLEAYRGVKRILEWEELEDEADGLGFLGYPGEGISYMLVEAGRLGKTEMQLILQRVDSYFEGYSVENINLPTWAASAVGTLDVNALFERHAPEEMEDAPFKWDWSQGFDENQKRANGD